MRNSKKIKEIGIIVNKNAQVNNENFEKVATKFKLLCEHLGINFVEEKRIVGSQVFGDRIASKLVIREINPVKSCIEKKVNELSKEIVKTTRNRRKPVTIAK